MQKRLVNVCGRKNFLHNKFQIRPMWCHSQDAYFQVMANKIDYISSFIETISRVEPKRSKFIPYDINFYFLVARKIKTSSILLFSFSFSFLPSLFSHPSVLENFSVDFWHLKCWVKSEFFWNQICVHTLIYLSFSLGLCFFIGVVTSSSSLDSELRFPGKWMARKFWKWEHLDEENCIYVPIILERVLQLLRHFNFCDQ